MDKLTSILENNNYSKSSIANILKVYSNYYLLGITQAIKKMEDKKLKPQTIAQYLNTISTIIRFLKPNISEKDNKLLRDTQFKYNEQFAKHYEDKSNKVDDIHSQLEEKKNNLLQASKKARKDNNIDEEIKLLRDYLLIALYIDIPPQRSEWRFLRLKIPKTKNEKSMSNYVKGKQFIINNFKVNSQWKDDELNTLTDTQTRTIDIPKSILSVINRLKKISDIDWLFGKQSSESDRVSFHNLQKRVMGVSTNYLRKLYVQRQGIHKEKIKQERQRRQNVASSMGHTISTQEKHYA